MNTNHILSVLDIIGIMAVFLAFIWSVEKTVDVFQAGMLRRSRVHRDLNRLLESERSLKSVVRNLTERLQDVEDAQKRSQ